jgi:RNA ligase
MGCVFLTRDNELHVSTPGSFLSDQAIWATKWIRKHENYNKIRDKFIKGELRVLVAEIICPLSRIVVPYDFEGMVSIAAHDNDGNYLCHTRLVTLSNDIGFDVCRKFSFDTVEDVKAYLDTVEDFEGFVLHWPHTGYRVKMKGEDYCIKHRIISSIHPNRIDEAIDSCNSNIVEDIYACINSVLCEFPEEFSDPYKNAFGLLKDEYERFYSRSGDTLDEFSDKTAKDLAIYLKSSDDEFHKIYFSHIMNAYNGRERNKKLILSIWKRVREKCFKNVEEEDAE